MQNGDFNLQDKRYSHIGFFEPITVNYRNLRDKLDEISECLYKYLSVQHDKYKILFPYNFA